MILKTDWSIKHKLEFIYKSTNEGIANLHLKE